MCLYPTWRKNRKYTATKKNGGVVPVMVDKRVEYIPTGCGKCIECCKQKANSWRVRLLEDIRHKTYKTNHWGVEKLHVKERATFVTLTFSNEAIEKLGSEIKKLTGYERDNEIAKKGMRLFLERYRKKHKKSCRHWMVTELGHTGTENIHMHGIIWTNETPNNIEKMWGYGYVWNSQKESGWVNEQTVNYIIKYVTKLDVEHKYYQPKIFTSTGIGAGYTERLDAKNNKFNGENTRDYYRSRTGHKMAMPIYFRNKIYTEEEREKLWLIKLDKEERYVMGNKIDVSNNEDEYWRAVEEGRIKNKQLGYGDIEIDWDRKKYEEERRNMMYAKRTGLKAETLKDKTNIWTALRLNPYVIKEKMRGHAPSVRRPSRGGKKGGSNLPFLYDNAFGRQTIMQKLIGNEKAKEIEYKGEKMKLPVWEW